jgi:glycosyltransferase involved in cell wall biosynthesis
MGKGLALIPAFNEEASIGDVIRRTLAQGLDVLVLDDGSTDATAQVARAAGAEVFSSRRNRGLGPTIRRGYQEALARGAEVVVQLDADGQYDPDEIPKLLAPIASREADMVLGARLRNVHYRMPPTKRFGNHAFTWVLRSITGAPIQDGQTGFRAIHRDVLLRCLPINRFSYTQEMIIRAAKEGFRIASVDVQFYPRKEGESRLFASPLQFAWRAWWIIIRTWRDYHPLKFFVVPGLFFLLLSLVGAAIVLEHLASTGHIAGRIGTLIVAGVLGLFGIQLVFMGLLADMIQTHTKS